MIDLHCHSTASDGLLAPTDVAAAAARVGLSAFALTDHDTTDGVLEAREAAAAFGVRVVAGCEFSVAVEWGEMHLLGYFVEPGDSDVEAALVHARTDRVRRARAMVSRLMGLGLVMSYDDIAAAANGAAVGRPHVARALLDRGHVNTIQQAFDKYIGRGRPAYVEKELPSLAEVAALVHRKGGVVSAAHLKSFGTISNLHALKLRGLDAVETRHPSHQGDYLANITNAALEVGLLRTGGSDWHGESDAGGSHADLGSQHVPDEWLVALEAHRPVVAAAR